MHFKSLTPTVSGEMRALAPGFAHVTVEAHGLAGGPSAEATSALLDDAARRLAARLDGRAPHDAPHMAAWRAVCTAFGARPSRTRNSVEALAKPALANATNESSRRADPTRRRICCASSASTSEIQAFGTKGLR